MGAVRKAAIGGVAGLALLGGIFSTEIKQVVAPDVTYGDEVRVRLYRGLGGRAFDRATDNFGLEARKRCGVRYYVAGQAGTDTSALAANSAVRKAKKVVLVGTSMGGKKARDTAEALAPQKVDLLLVDTVPWTGAIPANVVNQVTWRNTWPFQLGGGKPQGTKDDRPRAGTHGAVIHALRTHEEVVDEICRGVTHPSKRK